MGTIAASEQRGTPRISGQLLASVALVLAALLAALIEPFAKPSRAQALSLDLPNVLVIVTDDQRAGKASMEVMPKTKRLFGEGGTQFVNAVATTPLCCPSRASIFSGKYAHNHGVIDNGSGGNLDTNESMQATLDANGYQTAIAGKYFRGQLGDVRHFDHWTVFDGGKKYHDVPMNVDGEERTVSTYLTTFLRRKGIDYLHSFEENDSDPWFMYLAPYAPHQPATPEPRYVGTHVPRWRESPATLEKNLTDKPRHVRLDQGSKSALKRKRRKSLLSLKSVDDMVGRVFRTLRRQGELGNTLAIFMSDNGYLWYEHGLGQKRYPYAASIRIPMYARWPGHVQAGVESTKIVGNIDIAPTVYAATGLEPGYPVDGRSMLSGGRREEILIEFWRDPAHPVIPGWAGLWRPKRKFIEYETGEREFYGRSDPFELANRLGDGKRSNNPSDLARMTARLDLYRTCVARQCP